MSSNGKTGPGNPQKRRRRTRDEIERVTDFCEEAISQCLLTSQIKQGLRERFGFTNAATMGRYMRRARARIKEQAEAALDDQLPESVAFYRKLIRKSGASDRTKLRARQRLDLLLGLEAPARVEVAITPSPLAELARKALKEGASAIDSFVQIGDQLSAESAGRGFAGLAGGNGESG